MPAFENQNVPRRSRRRKTRARVEEARLGALLAALKVHPSHQSPATWLITAVNISHVHLREVRPEQGEFHPGLWLVAPGC